MITTLPSVVRLLVMTVPAPWHWTDAARRQPTWHASTAAPRLPLRALLDSAAGGTMDLEARNYDGEHPAGRRWGLSGRTWSPSEAAKPQEAYV